jgi:hypothetical protein
MVSREVLEKEEGPSELRLGFCLLHLNRDIQDKGPLELLVSEPLRHVSGVSVLSSCVNGDFDLDFLGRKFPYCLELRVKAGTGSFVSSGEIGVSSCRLVVR